ncbi:MAG: potassium channel protein [Planctomycetota bacterium]
MSAPPLRRIVIGLLIFLAVCCIAVGCYVAEGWDLSDAIYIVVITIFGVGYGEVKPIETTSLRALTIAVIVFGYGAVVYIVGGFIQLVIDGELQHLIRNRKMSQGIANLRDHTIICGYGRMGSIVAEELHRRELPFLIIDESESRVEEAQAAGMLAMVGNGTDEETLRVAQIEHARWLATLLPSDATNAFICVTAHDMNKSVQIISRGESRSAEKHLRRCGADHVVMAAAIGAHRATQIVVRPTAASVLQSAGSSHGINDELTAIGLQMEELCISSQSALVGKPLNEIQVRGNRGFLIVAVRSASGEVAMNPEGDTTLSSGDTVIVVGHTDDIIELCAAHTLKRQTITYRGATREI